MARAAWTSKGKDKRCAGLEASKQRVGEDNQRERETRKVPVEANNNGKAGDNKNS